MLQTMNELFCDDLEVVRGFPPTDGVTAACQFSNSTVPNLFITLVPNVAVVTDESVRARLQLWFILYFWRFEHYSNVST